MHLLKRGSKRIATGKQRKKVAILGSLKDWQNSQDPGSQFNSQPQMVDPQPII